MAAENTDTWRSITLGDSGSLAPLFNAAGNAAAVNKATLTVAKAQYESAKLLALATLNQGDSVIVPSPAYPIHPYGAVIAGAEVIYIKVFC